MNCPKPLFSLYLLLFFLCDHSFAQKNNIDWQDFLARHDLIWTEAPQAWHDGPFMGNGMLGSLFFQQDDHHIRINLGRTDVEDHKEGGGFLTKPRLPIGYFLIETKGKITGFNARLDLYNAEARASITTTSGSINLNAIVHSEEMLIAYELQGNKAEKEIDIQFQPLAAIAPARLQADLDVAKLGEAKVSKSRLRWHKEPYEYNPAPSVSTVEGYQLCHQPLVAGGETATAWNIKKDKDKHILFVSIAHSYPENNAKQEAISQLKKVNNTSYEQLQETHRQWWHNFYPKSFLSIDNTQLESFYWIQVYKFASGARKNRGYMDTMGPWVVANTAWASGWFDLNTQLSYWFLSTANRLEVAESVFTKMDQSHDIFVANMPERFEGKCAGIGTIAPQSFISPFPSSLGFMGDFTWLCHDYWMMLERTMDHDRIKTKYFPLLKKAINTYLYVMVKEKDGSIHLPPTKSPEYGSSDIDVNYNLALFRWGVNTLISIAERYHINDPLMPQWKEVKDKLVAYPQNENGYMISKNINLDKGHRHYSHLLMIYPLNEITIEQEENKALIAKSVKYWAELDHKAMTGYSWSGASAMYALQEDGEKAAHYLDRLLNMTKYSDDNQSEIHPTTMYTETARVQPVTETPFSACEALQQMVLQGWGGKIRVFPAIPEAWKNISFDGFLAPGGFEVSAVRSDGKTKMIKIKSTAGEICILKSNIENPSFKGIKKNAVKKEGKDTYRIALKKGEEVTLLAKGEKNVAIKAVAAKKENCNFYGMH